MSKEESKSYKKFILLLAGSFVLVLGITLNLIWWREFVMIGKGIIGFILALAGLLMMYGVNKK